MPTEYALSYTRTRGLVINEPRAITFARIARRVRAVIRLFARRRRARRRFDDLRHLDERTLRDLGIDRSELESVVAELGGRTAATRRRSDPATWTSPTSSFRIRAVDSSL